MKQRNIAVCIILTIVTCGIYGLYWEYCIVEDVNTMTGDSQFSGIVVILLSIVTAGIFLMYWMYVTGKKLDDMIGDNGNRAVIYLVLAIFELSIIDFCLLQNEINQRAA
ncbi:MAG: DUF4234 domain-containing protein [Lachnospiraceae bacterium]|nr:DUF4234 domain-containing protein [Lachnospiraceae bacterium]